MKRKLQIKVAMLVLTLFLLFSNQVLATINIPLDSNGKTYYDWTLGKYNSATKTFSPSDITVFQWNNMMVRTIGPTAVWVDGFKEGTVLSFSDKNSSEDNGYPMVESSQWNAWINLFGGGSNKDFVLANLKSWFFDTNGKTFANLSQLAELSGGRGLSYNVASGSIIYGKSTGPTASITPDRYSCKVGESITFNLSATNKAMSYHFVDMTFKDDKGTTYVNNQRFLSDTAYQTVTKTFTAAGNYLFTLTVNDGVFRYTTKQLLISVSNNPVDPVQPPDPPPPLPPPPPAAENLPPTAIFSLPPTCYEGETVDVDESSFDLDGIIKSWTWNYEPTNGVVADLKQGGGTVTFNETGSYDLKLTVMDDDGAFDSVTHSITVKKAIPIAVISNKGTLKENRRVILDSSKSITSEKYPIDHSRDEWTITPVTGGTTGDIKWGTGNGAAQDVLFKKEGIYRVGLRVHNEKYDSEWAYKDLIISPDLPPAANFIKPAITFRRPADSNNASIILQDRSFSLDNDIISQRIWKYKFDSDNDGSFLDEIWVTLDSGNNPKPVLKTKKVGKYLFELECKESFGQETIAQFITDADYRRGDTLTKPQADKIIDVQNIAPVTTFTATLKPKVDIVFSQGFMKEYASRFPNMVNNLEGIVGSKLAGKGIDYQFYNTATVPIGGMETITRHWSPTDTASNLSNIYNGQGQIVFDMGKIIARDSIDQISLNATSFVPGWGAGYIRLSSDGINWIDHSNALTKYYFPVESFRYIAISDPNCNGTLTECWFSVTYDSSYNVVSNNEHQFSNISQPTHYTWDIGKNVSKQSLKQFGITIKSPGGYFGTNYLYDGIYTYEVSADGSTWYPVTVTLPSNYGMTATRLVDNNSIPISFFRYTRFSFTYASSITFSQSVAVDNTPRANLADIQAKAETTYRSDAQKYIVSLAEEPYTDLNATNLDNTANALNSKKASLVVLSDAANLANAQQLTSKVTNQKLITTTYDVGVPLGQLADYVIGTATTAPLSGTITVLLGQAISCEPSYSDYENDPKVTDNWYYFHDPNFLDNNSGLSFYHNKTISGPVAALDKVGKYDVQYKAQDDPANTDIRFLNYRMWSDPAPTAIIVHRKPVADFSVQAGTINVTDLSYDPDFQFRRPDKGVVQWLWKWRPSASSAWTNGKPSGITALGTFVVHLEVRDVYGAWSDPVEKTITVTTLQRPPAADFNWTPTLIYEGDTVNLNNLSTDPDGDPLTFLWTVFNPLGGTTTFTTKNGTIANVLPGTYWVTLRAADPGGMSDVITKSFAVNPLGLSGSVNHTPEWNAKRISFNQKTTGTDDSPRAYKVFWAGEAFVLQGITTDTATSATKAQTVTVTFIDRGITINLSPNASRTTWTGEMSEDDFETIADGTYDFRFVATYSNGVVKTVNVPIEISGTWLNYYNFHRSW